MCMFSQADSGLCVPRVNKTTTTWTAAFILKSEHCTELTSISVVHGSLLSQLQSVGQPEQLQLLCQFQAESMFPVTSTLNPEGTVSSLTTSCNSIFSPERWTFRINSGIELDLMQANEPK